MTDESSPALMTVLLTVLTGSMIFSFGALYARAKQAAKDHKDTKAKVPVLRKAFWALAWSTVKVGFWIVLGVLVLAAWAVRDVT